jgi:uncharacterized protein (TIGR03790 family)
MRHIVTPLGHGIDRRAGAFVCAVVAGVLPHAYAADTAQALSDRVLVVRNADSPVSCAVADDYCLKRHVSHTITIHCADAAVSQDKETIAQDDYVRAVEQPIAAWLKDHPTIDFIVLTKGIPIRVRGGTSGWVEADGPNPSVDSCLAALGYDQLPDAKAVVFSGKDVHGRAWLNRYWNATVPFTHARFGGYLVTRLDGYTAEDASALLTRALESERQRPQGSFLLDIQPEFGLGDKASQPAPLPSLTITGESAWSEFNADMAHAAEILGSRHLACELDQAPAFVGGRSGLLGYFSWGSNDARFSNDAYQSLRFGPGSLSDTAVSTSARTFLPTSGGQTLISDLIAHGVTGVKGYVNEPLLQAIASPSIVVERYTAGFCLAEAFYAASHFVGWEDVVIGDPICRPYAAQAVPARRP